MIFCLLLLQLVAVLVESSPSYNRFQCAYWRGYSTETALTRLLNDVYINAGQKSRLQFDLSAAFDTRLRNAHTRDLMLTLDSPDINFNGFAHILEWQISICFCWRPSIIQYDLQVRYSTRIHCCSHCTCHRSQMSVTPRQKKKGLDHSVFTNFRPISNTYNFKDHSANYELPLMSRVLEWQSSICFSWRPSIIQYDLRVRCSTRIHCCSHCTCHRSKTSSPVSTVTHSQRHWVAFITQWRECSFTSHSQYSDNTQLYLSL